jgi:hypothetical protein
MPFVQADLDALDLAIKSGARQVAYTDRTVTYRNLEEMLSIRRLILDDIATAAGTPPAPRQARILASKGL